MAALLATWVLAGTAVYGGELKIELLFGKPNYKAGDSIEFTVCYQNSSDHPIRVLAKERYYISDLLSLERRGDHKKAGYLRPEGESQFLGEELAEYIVLLEPGDSVARKYRGQVASSLPSGYEKKSNGLFLVFNGSAIELPGPGKFEATSSYDEKAEDPLNEYVTLPPKLWQGEARSAPVLLNFQRP
jgi:hypothetical protein